LADLTAEIDETAGVNGLGKRTHRRREFRRGNCGLAHGKLLWTMGSMISFPLYDGDPTIPQLHNYHHDIDCYARFLSVNLTRAKEDIVARPGYWVSSR
jgi:hypothetical protein